VISSYGVSDLEKPVSLHVIAVQLVKTIMPSRKLIYDVPPGDNPAPMR
jgi:hypothetical protein